jgi:quercetin dioxygenase-like cupin family protein
MTRALVAGVLVAAGLYQADPAEPVRTPLLQNATVAVTHLRFAPGQRETTHTHPFPLVIVQISPGDVDIKEQDTSKRGNRPGEVWYVPAERPHSITPRQAGGNPVDLVAIALLPGRQPAPGAPATEAPPGITRATLVDNADVRVARARFEPNAREPVHTHPNDLVTVQITGGSVEMSIGPEHSLLYRDPGFVQFVPRNIQHSYASADTKPFELVSVSIK